MLGLAAIGQLAHAAEDVLRAEREGKTATAGGHRPAAARLRRPLGSDRGPAGRPGPAPQPARRCVEALAEASGQPLPPLGGGAQPRRPRRACARRLPRRPAGAPPPVARVGRRRRRRSGARRPRPAAAPARARPEDEAPAAARPPSADRRSQHPRERRDRSTRSGCSRATCWWRARAAGCAPASWRSCSSASRAWATASCKLGERLGARDPEPRATLERHRERPAPAARRRLPLRAPQRRRHQHAARQPGARWPTTWPRRGWCRCPPCSTPSPARCATSRAAGQGGRPRRSRTPTSASTAPCWRTCATRWCTCCATRWTTAWRRPTSAQALGKPRHGPRARSACAPTATCSHVEVEDDGRGIDPERLRRRWP